MLIHLIKIPFRILWKTWFVLNFAAGLILLYPFFYILLSREAWYPAAFKLKRFWAGWILYGGLIFPRVIKKYDPSQLKQPVVFCGNHTSYLDIVASYYTISNFYIFLGKAELNNAPLFNIFFKRMNISVDRKSRMGSYKAFEQAAAEIDKGNSVFIFPEATISKKAPELLPYKNGAFKLAIDKQVPIVPIVFIDNFHRLQNGGFFKSNGSMGRVYSIIHPPIETKGLTENDQEMLKNKLKEVIQGTLNEYYMGASSLKPHPSP